MVAERSGSIVLQPQGIAPLSALIVREKYISRAEVIVILSFFVKGAQAMP